MLSTTSEPSVPAMTPSLWPTQEADDWMLASSPSSNTKEMALVMSIPVSDLTHCETVLTMRFGQNMRTKLMP